MPHGDKKKKALDDQGKPQVGCYRGGATTRPTRNGRHVEYFLDLSVFFFLSIFFADDNDAVILKKKKKPLLVFISRLFLISTLNVAQQKNTRQCSGGGWYTALIHIYIHH